jgi:Tol biopolymer transport system component
MSLFDARDCFAAWKAHTVALSTPVPVPKVNSPQEDRDPFLTPDERTLYFGSRRTGSQRSDVYKATRADLASDFATPARADDISTADDDTKLTLTDDGLTAFLASDRPNGEGASDIWTATRATTNDPFGTFTQDNLANVNDADNQLDPQVSGDGLHLYLAVNTTPQHIAVAERATTSDPFGTPTTVIDSGVGDADPMPSPDELVIVFSSNRVGTGFGGGNLWYATRGAGAVTFGTPDPIPNVNGNTNEGDPVLSKDGCRLYFARDGGTAGYELLFSTVN